MSLVLTAFVAVSSLLIERVAVLLNTLSSIIFLASLVGYSQYFFGWPLGGVGKTYNLEAAVFGTVFAFLLSPYGLTTITLRLVEKLDKVNGAIKSV